MKKILEIKKDNKRLLRVTITGEEEVVLKCFEYLSDGTFYFGKVGTKLKKHFEVSEKVNSSFEQK